MNEAGKRLLAKGFPGISASKVRKHFKILHLLLHLNNAGEDLK